MGGTGTRPAATGWIETRRSTRADARLWFINQGNNSIGRITTGGQFNNYTDPSIFSAVGIAAGPDRAVWFTNGSAIGRVGDLKVQGPK
jgi:streptogramin lyase